MIVAVMTNPMRARYCAEFLYRRAELCQTAAVVADGRAFGEVELPAATRVFVATARSAEAPSERILRSSLGRQAARWVRSGSTTGSTVERAIRLMMWRLRYVDRITSLMRGQRSDSGASAKAIIEILTKLDEAEPITELVAFDAFDLPALMDFADERGIPVRLR